MPIIWHAQTSSCMCCRRRPTTAFNQGFLGFDPDPSWTPLIRVPAHPEYPSGHTVSGESPAGPCLTAQTPASCMMVLCSTRVALESAPCDAPVCVLSVLSVGCKSALGARPCWQLHAVMCLLLPISTTPIAVTAAAVPLQCWCCLPPAVLLQVMRSQCHVSSCSTLQ
jgi:hypothetical protein